MGHVVKKKGVKMTVMQLVAYRAHTNIALIKYWGKRNRQLFLPMTSSLSLTLDAFYTDTRVSIEPNLTRDCFILNDQVQADDETQKISRFINLFRQQSAIQDPLLIESTNHVPTAAGLASSASAFSALGLCLNDLLGLNLDTKTLSTYVRQGSGSATRSLFGGFVLWHAGQGRDSASSYSQQIDPADWDIHMLVIAINKGSKAISSRQGMEHTVQTSPFYQLWPQEVDQDLQKMLGAIKARDFDQIGQIAEHNAMKMHATMLAAQPSFTYFQPDTVRAIQLVQDLRREGVPCYLTMDAGPNVKVLCQSPSIPILQQRLSQYFRPDQLILAHPGPGPKKLEEI